MNTNTLRSKQYRATSRAKINARRRKLYALNKERFLAANKVYRLKTSDELKARRRRRVYGTDGEHLYQKQRGLCGVCTSPMLRRHSHRRAAHLDHNHATGKVRGWLCSTCNVGLGHFNDDVALLRKALRYLEKHRG